MGLGPFTAPTGYDLTGGAAPSGAGGPQPGGGDAGGGGTDTVTPGTRSETGGRTAAPLPAPTPTLAPTVKVRSSKLQLRANRVSASLACAGVTTCTGTAALRTAAKVKGRYVVLTKAVKYSLAAGTTRTVRLTLSSAGKRQLRGKRRVSVALDVAPVSGAAVSKRLTLTQSAS